MVQFGEEAEEELNMNEAFGRGLGMLSAAAQGAGQGLEGIGRVGQVGWLVTAEGRMVVFVVRVRRSRIRSGDS